MTEPQYPPEWDTRPQQVEEAPARDYPTSWTRPEDRVSPSSFSLDDELLPTSDARRDNPETRVPPLSEDARGQQQLDALYRAVGKPELADRSAHPFTIN